MRRPSQRHFAAENLDPRLRSGLVGHWTGGGSGRTWFDRSGRGNHGTIVGAKWTLGEGGKRHALEFGSGCYVSTSTGFNPGTGNYGAFAWVYCRARGAQSTIFSSLYSTGIELFVSSGSGLSAYVPNTQGVTATLPFDDLRWYHVGITRRGSAVTTWQDGLVTGTATDSDPTTFANFDIGRRLSSDLWWYGIIDDVRLYDRALSSTEISLLARPDFLTVVPRRWFVGLSQLTTAATSSVSTWVSPTAATRASVAASPSIASWASPAASTKASVSASPSVSTWVVPNATTRTPRILPTVSVSRTVYDPIEVS